MATDEMQRIAPEVVSALHAEHELELRAFLTGLLRDADLAQEAAQATFGRLVEQGHTAREESIKGWLFRVAYHEAMALRRRQAVQQRSLARLAGLPSREFESPDQALSRRDAAERARAALDRLSPEQRIVVEKRIYEDKTFAVIAAELGIPLGTVLTRMRTALQVLRKRLEADDG